MFIEITLMAYILDMLFKEFDYIFKFFSKLPYVKHPIVLIGNCIKFFEINFYKDSILRGVILTVFVITIISVVISLLQNIENIFFQAFLCSFTISSSMLYDCVKKIIDSKNPKYDISMLVSRDTKNMSDSDINKAAIETYAENLSDGVIAPIFYLLLFGPLGAYIYKAINTLDSMVGYRNKKYENFGKFSARVDDIANYIPSRITAILISFFFFCKKAFLGFYTYGKKHESINAGHPISAMALCLNVKLGGPTSYFNTIKNKPYFGDGEIIITKEHLQKAISIKLKIDIFIISFLLIILYFNNLI